MFVTQLLVISKKHNFKNIFKIRKKFKFIFSKKNIISVLIADLLNFRI